MKPVVIDSGVDAGMPWHYGDPLREQRAIAAGTGVVDVSNRDVLKLTGEDRLRLLDALSTQRLRDLKPGESASAYLLDASGRIRFFFAVAETGVESWVWTEPGWGVRLADHLNSMRFRLDCDAHVRPDMAVMWVGEQALTQSAHRRTGVVASRESMRGREVFLARSLVADFLAMAQPAGLWAHTAIRIEEGIPRFSVDTDPETIPGELGVRSPEVSVDKGCYPGQEAVTRARLTGSAPRKLVRLHFDGSQERFLTQGTVISTPDGASVGFLGSMSYHYELGAIGLGLVDRSVCEGTTLFADEIPVSIESLR